MPSRTAKDAEAETRTRINISTAPTSTRASRSSLIGRGTTSRRCPRTLLGVICARSGRGGRHCHRRARRAGYHHFLASLINEAGEAAALRGDSAEGGRRVLRTATMAALQQRGGRRHAWALLLRGQEGAVSTHGPSRRRPAITSVPCGGNLIWRVAAQVTPAPIGETPARVCAQFVREYPRQPHAICRLLDGVRWRLADREQAGRENEKLNASGPAPIPASSVLMSLRSRDAVDELRRVDDLRRLELRIARPSEPSLAFPRRSFTKPSTTHQKESFDRCSSISGSDAAVRSPQRCCSGSVIHLHDLS